MQSFCQLRFYPFKNGVFIRIFIRFRAAHETHRESTKISPRDAKGSYPRPFPTKRKANGEHVG